MYVSLLKTNEKMPMKNERIGHCKESLNANPIKNVG